jgi:predicted kinase
MSPLRIYMPIGLPGAGKTELGARLQVVNNVHCISRDAIRNQFGPFSVDKETEVVAIMMHTLRGLMHNGRDAFIDCTNLRIDERMRNFKWVRKFSEQTGTGALLIGVHLPCPIEDSVARKGHKIGEEVIQKLARSFEQPSSAGIGLEFHELHVVIDSRTEDLTRIIRR